jgi:hypothetical protein
VVGRASAHVADMHADTHERIDRFETSMLDEAYPRG